MTTAFLRGQEGTGAVEDGWRGIHAIETGFIIQIGYKEMRFHLTEATNIFAVTKLAEMAVDFERIGLWNAPASTQAALMEMQYDVAEDHDWIDDAEHWYLMVYGRAVDVHAHALHAATDLGIVYAADAATVEVHAIPNNDDGYVLNGWNLDGVDEAATATNENIYVVPAQTLGTIHKLKPRTILGWSIVGDGSVTVPGYRPVSSGSGSAYTQNIGSPPPGMKYQWDLDGYDMGINHDHVTVPAQTNGTNHTISVSHVWI
jgi:hypothetical protein